MSECLGERRKIFSWMYLWIQFGFAIVELVSEYLSKMLLVMHTLKEQWFPPLPHFVFLFRNPCWNKCRVLCGDFRVIMNSTASCYFAKYLKYLRRPWLSEGRGEGRHLAGVMMTPSLSSNLSKVPEHTCQPGKYHCTKSRAVLSWCFSLL